METLRREGRNGRGHSSRGVARRSGLRRSVIGMFGAGTNQPWLHFVHRMACCARGSSPCVRGAAGIAARSPHRSHAIGNTPPEVSFEDIFDNVPMDIARAMPTMTPWMPRPVVAGWRIRLGWGQIFRGCCGSHFARRIRSVATGFDGDQLRYFKSTDPT